MDLRCPKCNSTDLKKLSLAYEEGISRMNTRTRLRGIVVGTGGPDLVVGSGTTKGIQQTAISKAVAPPTKWSYMKLVGWSVVVFLSVGWIVFYANTIATNSQSVVSLPLGVYAVFASCVFAGLFVGFWKHNSTYAEQFAQWNRSFLCQKCGAVSEQALD